VKEIHVYSDVGGPGWMPIQALALLAARVFQSDVRPVRTQRSSRLNLFRHLLLGAGARRRADCGALVFSDRGGVLATFAREPDLFRQYGSVAVYICDSFWPEAFRYPRLMQQFDLVVRMCSHDGDFYRKWAGDRALYLPFGVDALARGGWDGARDIDVLRVGRQPGQWDDDDRAAAIFAEAGITYHGRPPFVEGHEAGMVSLFSYYRRAKFTIAHTNLISAHGSTHPTKDYITARWTDSAASGTTVVGVQPKTDSAMQDLLWPEGLVHLESVEPEHVVERVRDALEAWTPERARLNYVNALERLDWRWRLREIARRLDWPTAVLDAELEQLTKTAQAERAAMGA